MGNMMRVWVWLLMSSCVKFFAAADTGGMGGGGGAAGAGSAGSSASPAATQSPSSGQGPQGGNSPSTGAGAGEGAGTGTGTGQGAGNNDNLAQLRQGYERYKGLGEFEQVQTAHQQWSAMSTQANQLGESLGYTPDSVAREMAKDPVGTLSFLRQEAAKATATGTGTGDAALTPEKIQEMIRKETAPAMQHVIKQKVDAANALFESEVGTLFDSHPAFKGSKDVPPEVRSVVMDMVSESIKYDDAAVKALYEGNKTASVKKIFDGVMERFLKTVNTYNTWQNNKGQQGTGTGQVANAGGNGARKFSLDDIASGNEDALNQFATVRAERIK